MQEHILMDKDFEEDVKITSNFAGISVYFFVFYFKLKACSWGLLIARLTFSIHLLYL